MLEIIKQNPSVGNNSLAKRPAIKGIIHARNENKKIRIYTRLQVPCAMLNYAISFGRFK